MNMENLNKSPPIEYNIDFGNTQPDFRIEGIFLFQNDLMQQFYILK